ncbi:hypothetical protein [Amycolatopsis vancoresmycina]|uniref:hypothetical protein n=1 Tax=Amycolatopsis vancoresmycina TaxID=208444 RepID=UPI0012DC8121|nr:hypothetical protein [Amycolatopsis vancoresmycina]
MPVRQQEHPGRDADHREHAARPEDVTVEKGHTRDQQDHRTRHGPPAATRHRHHDQRVRDQEAPGAEVTQQVADLEQGPDHRGDAVLGAGHGARGDPGDGVESSVEGGEPEGGQPPRPADPPRCRGQQEPLRRGRQGEHEQQDDVQLRPPRGGGRVQHRGVEGAEPGEQCARHREQRGPKPS